MNARTYKTIALVSLLALALSSALAYLLGAGTPRSSSRTAGSTDSGTLTVAAPPSISGSTTAPLPAAKGEAASAATVAGAQERAQVEAEKAAFLRAPRQEQQLQPEMMADPEQYEAGPGPHLERYGGRSGALPVSARPEDAEVTTVLESEGSYPKLHVWVPSFRNSTGQSVAISAQVLGEDGKPAGARDVSLTIVERSSQRPEQAVMEKSAGAYIYEFQAPPSQESVTAYDYVVLALVETDHGEEMRTAQGAFQVHGAVARVLSAEAKVEQASGNVRLELPIEIASPGDYTFYAELWGGKEGDVSIAFAAEHAERLRSGRHVAQLTFGGLIIKDRKVDGPFRIRNVRVRRVSDFPFAEADPVKVLPETPAWSADSFG